jgi:hypothetical protein
LGRIGVRIGELKFKVGLTLIAMFIIQ